MPAEHPTPTTGRGGVGEHVASGIVSADDEPMDSDHDDLDMDLEEAVARLVAMGFPEDHAREALRNAESHGY